MREQAAEDAKANAEYVRHNAKAQGCKDAKGNANSFNRRGAENAENIRENAKRFNTKTPRYRSKNIVAQIERLWVTKM